ncbi:unnamed protein product [Symbiodinium sp. CCMP2592]|nr:unnamed protein product [Symbiodinium sp. CCMP2592]
MPASRPYTVCKCGSWVYTDRIGPGKLEACRACGKKWPGVPKQARTEQEAPSRVWKPGGFTARARQPRRKEEGAVSKALLSLWAKFTPEVQKELMGAGFQGPDAQPKEDPLLTLLKAHENALPQEVQDALHASEPKETPEQAAASASREYKSCTVKLRDLGQKKVQLQARIDDTKAKLREQLEGMKDLLGQIAEAQKEVDKVAEQFKSAVLEEPKEDPGSDTTLAQLIADAGITLTQEQLDKIKAVEEGHAIKKRKHDAPGPEAPVQAANSRGGRQCGSAAASCSFVRPAVATAVQGWVRESLDFGKGWEVLASFPCPGPRMLPLCPHCLPEEAMCFKMRRAALLDPYVPSGEPDPNPNLQRVDLEALPSPIEAAGKCMCCGQAPSLGLTPSQEVKDFVHACRMALLTGHREQLLTAMSDVMSYCPDCLCQWAAAHRTDRQPLAVRASLSGPAYFFACEEEQDFDVQDEVFSVPLITHVSQAQAVAGFFDGVRTGVPFSRRARRRYNRRLRLASIEPLRGAPKTPAEEVMTGSWTYSQEEVGRWPGGLGGPGYDELSPDLLDPSTARDVQRRPQEFGTEPQGLGPIFSVAGPKRGSEIPNGPPEGSAKPEMPPDVRPVGGTREHDQHRALLSVKQAVIAGAEGALLEVVEAMEQHGCMQEGTFVWRAAELAVETHEDVPRHVACWAIEDALANLTCPKVRPDVHVISANITAWRKDLCSWIAQHKAAVLLLQETHLSPDQPDLIEAQLGFHGYNVFSVPAHPTGKGGTSGGLAICFRKHLNMRRVHHFVRAGVGFQVAALRLKDADCYFVNVYLKAGEGFQGSHNAPIIAHLIPFLRSVRGLFFVAGDFNEDFEVIAATSLEQEAKGRWISSGESTCAGGGNIDYGLMSPSLASAVSLSIDWVTPFAPHAALHWSLQVQHLDVKLPQLVPFKPMPLRPQPFHLRLTNDAQGEQAATACHGSSVHLLGVEVSNEGLSSLFASLSRDIELSVYGDCQGRGARVSCCRKPLMLQTAPDSGWGGAHVSFWNRVIVWLEACSRHFQVSPFAKRAVHCFADHWHGSEEAALTFHSELQAFIDEGCHDLCRGLLDVAKAQKQYFVKQWQQSKSVSYEKWLRQATSKGMRPLFKSVRAEEVITIRPFLEAPVQERIYLRWRQWFDLWSHLAGVDQDLLATLRVAAVEQAHNIAPMPLDKAVAFFKKLPSKAPGLDGWTCEVLRNLSAEAVQAILDFLHHCEKRAAWPDQLIFALIALLPKSEKRERPIALLHVLYRAWAKLRWPLVSAWQSAYARRAHWDKALPGGQVLDVALARLMLGETTRRCRHHLITLFLDMETFYDRCLFNDVISSGLTLAYPPLILHQAMLTYMGPRFVQSEGALCPPIWPGRGVLAGCPAAPSVSKLVIHPVAAKLASKKSASNLDIWIDDLSLDTVHKSPLQVASDSLKLFRGLRQDLESKGAQVSLSKTCFVTSSTEAAKALGKILDASDPQVKPMNRDLGITSAGGRRRVLGLAESRRKKAAGRSRKLNKLAVPGRAHRLRIVRASLCSAGLWGHQAQGVSPKRRKFYRTLVAKHLGRHKLGCMDLTFIVNRRRCEDPHLTLLRQHVRAVARVFRRWDACDQDKFRSTWADIWLWLMASKHPWKKVNGPLAALMAYLHELGVQAPQAHRWSRDGSILTIDWSSPDATRRVWHWLLPVWEDVRLQRVSLNDGCQNLRGGLDATVPERLQKRKFFNKNMTVNLQALWQGALVSRSKQGWCTRCHCPLDLQHVLWDCPFIAQPFPAPQHFRAARQQFPWPSLWLRGLVPQEATALLRDKSAEGYVFEGLWRHRQVIPSDSLVFASDASGGPGARDHRSACVTWALAAYRLEPEGPKRVASITCVPVQPLTVAAAEQQAAFELFGRVSGSFDVTVDCKAVTHVVAKQSPPHEGPVPWGECWDDRSRAAVTWVPSHKSAAFFAERNLDEWRRLINEDVDALCGARSAEVYSSACRPDLKTIDRLCEDVCLHLAKKVGFILKHKSDKGFPWVMQRASQASQSQPCSSRVIGGDKFLKPKNPTASKPNKKQRLKDMLASPDPALGHVWRDCESKAVNNFSIQCTVCNLYLEQCNSQDVFDRKASNPCLDIAASLPSAWQVHETHDMANKGSFFTCTKCLAIVKIAATSTSSVLQAPCKGLGRKMNSKTQARSMANVEGSKNRTIEASLQGRQPQVAAVGVAMEPRAKAGPKVKAKPKCKPKSQCKDSSKQTRLSFA